MAAVIVDRARREARRVRVGEARARRGTLLASRWSMKLTDAAFRGRVVLSSDGLAIGEITRLFVEAAGWRVCSFEVRLRKDVAERIGIPRTLFHGATIEISTDLVQSTGDAVILSVSAEALRQPAPPEPSAPAPVPPEPPVPPGARRAADGMTDMHD
jgi:hypothetical protein